MDIEEVDDLTGTIYTDINIHVDGVPCSVAASTVPMTGVGATREPTVCGPAIPQVNLPKLPLQPFPGDLTQWVTFWDSFDSAVHSNAQLSPIELFNYLQSFLCGMHIKRLQV